MEKSNLDKVNSKVNYKQIKWEDIQIGDKFLDGSTVLSIHERYTDDCYKVSYSKVDKMKNFQNCSILDYTKNKINQINNYVHEMELSNTHLLLCDISECDKETKMWIDETFGGFQIPTLVDQSISIKNIMLEDKILELTKKDKVYKDEVLSILKEVENSNNILNIETKAVYSDMAKIDENHYWIPIEALHNLVNVFKQSIKCNKFYLNEIQYVGKKEVFCVETDSHRFETGPEVGYGLIHHNSVTLRNIIFHCLTHSEQIMIALIDLKLTEFEPFKGVKGVVAVANTVREAVEVLRIGREVMYKRNAQLAKLGLNDIKDFKPTQPTDEVVVAGRLLKDTDTVEIRKGEEIKTVTVKELEQYLD